MSDYGRTVARLVSCFGRDSEDVRVLADDFAFDNAVLSLRPLDFSFDDTLRRRALDLALNDTLPRPRRRASWAADAAHHSDEYDGSDDDQQDHQD